MRIILEGLEFQAIATRVLKKHRRLLAGLACKSQIRRNDELDSKVGQPFAQNLPCIPIQNHTPMGNRNIFAIHGIAATLSLVFRYKVGADLVAVKVKVDPTICAATDSATKHFGVKFAGCDQIFHWKCKVKWAN